MSIVGQKNEDKKLKDNKDIVEKEVTFIAVCFIPCYMYLPMLVQTNFFIFHTICTINLNASISYSLFVVNLIYLY